VGKEKHRVHHHRVLDHRVHHHQAHHQAPHRDHHHPAGEVHQVLHPPAEEVKEERDHQGQVQVPQMQQQHRDHPQQQLEQMSNP
jgi:hypothetical protein